MRQYMWKHLVLITDLLFINQKLLVSIYCGPGPELGTGSQQDGPISTELSVELRWTMATRTNQRVMNIRRKKVSRRDNKAGEEVQKASVSCARQAGSSPLAPPGKPTLEQLLKQFRKGLSPELTSEHLRRGFNKQRGSYVTITRKSFRGREQREQRLKHGVFLPLTFFLSSFLPSLFFFFIFW